MKQKYILILIHIIFIWSSAVTVRSFFCFATYEKMPCTVINVESYPEDTIVHLLYTVNGVAYERVQYYNGGKSIKKVHNLLSGIIPRTQIRQSAYKIFRHIIF